METSFTLFPKEINLRSFFNLHVSGHCLQEVEGKILILATPSVFPKISYLCLMVEILHKIKL